MLVVGFVIFGAVTASVVSDMFAGRSAGDASEVAAIYGFLLLWLTLVWRFTMLGIWINDDAVRIRHITYTRTLPWASVAAIESREAMILSWARWHRSVWVIPTDGRPVETPLQTQSSGMLAVSPRRYDEVLRLLQEAHGSHRFSP